MPGGIRKKLSSDLSLVISVPYEYMGGVVSDGTYVYFTDLSNGKLVKYLTSDLSFVSEIGSYGTGNDQFDSPSFLALIDDAPIPPVPPVPITKSFGNIIS